MNIWDLYETTKYFDGSPTVNEDVAKILKSHGHSSGKIAGCTNTMSALFYKAGDINAIGGYANNNVPLVQNAKKAKIWHDGEKGILPGDVIVFGRDGKTNHSELAIGNDIDMSGNYNDGCSRRTRSSHSSKIVGYVRPKFSAVPDFNNLQITILAAETYLGTFGKEKTRETLLSVFGTKNKEAIQKQVSRITNDNNLIAFDLAVYTISGHAGNASYRKKRLGKYYDMTQKKITEISNLAGKSIEKAAQDVLKGYYGNNKVREFLLKFNKYDSNQVQLMVNSLLNNTKKDNITVTQPFTDYQIYLSTKINIAKLKTVKISPRPIRVIEPEDYTAQEVQEIRKKGYRVLAYLSLGTNEKSRSWFNKYKIYNLQQLGDWPDEYYVDVRKTEWREHLITEAKKYKAMGFDGWWLDNLDVYEYNKSSAMYTACLSVLKSIKAIGGYVMVNGGMEFFEKFMDNDTKYKGLDSVNGVTQEEVYSLIKDYEKKNKNNTTGIFGEQTKDMHNEYKSYMKRLIKHNFEAFLFEYTLDSNLIKRIISFCTTYKMTGYYIAKDVNL